MIYREEVNDMKMSLNQMRDEKWVLFDKVNFIIQKLREWNAQN